jgi:NAD(P)-dependent dehydrogenase (short-subunit alcohol dehydrogenase family)
VGELKFEGRVAIVTGAGRGLGREYATLLASRGARLVVNDLPAGDADSPESGPARVVAAELRELGGEAVADEHSVASPQGGAAIVRRALDAFGRVDIIINNAGGMSDDFAETLAVHLNGGFWVTQPAWQSMKDQEYGRIVNITSGVGLFGSRIPTGVSERNGYAAAKMGMVGLTKNLAVQGAPYNIKANALAPVAIGRRTDDLSEDVRAWLTAFDPGLVAPIVAWLTHQDCPVSGEIFSAGGGRVARVFIGETVGYTSTTLTLEDVRDHFDQIRDESGYLLPADLADELEVFRAHLKAAGG